MSVKLGISWRGAGVRVGAQVVLGLRQHVFVSSFCAWLFLQGRTQVLFVACLCAVKGAVRNTVAQRSALHVFPQRPNMLQTG